MVDKKFQKKKDREKRLKAERTRQIQAADAEWHLELAVSAYRREDYQSALSHVDKILKIRPEWPSALRLRAVLAVEYERDHGTAVPFLEKIIRKDEDDGNVIFQLANCYFQQRRYPEEIALLESYLERLKSRRDKAAREDKRKIQDWLAETRYNMERAATMSSTPLAPAVGLAAPPAAAISRKDVRMGSPRRRTEQTLQRKPSGPASSPPPRPAVAAPARPTGRAISPILGEPAGNPAGEAATAIPLPKVMAAIKQWARQMKAPPTTARAKSPHEAAVPGPTQTSLFPPEQERRAEPAGPIAVSSLTSRAAGKPGVPSSMSAESPAAGRPGPPAAGKSPAAGPPALTLPGGTAPFPDFAPASPAKALRPVPAPFSAAATPPPAAARQVAPVRGGDSKVTKEVMGEMAAAVGEDASASAPRSAAATLPSSPPALDLSLFTDPRNLALAAPLHVREAGGDFAARIAAAPPAAPEDYLLHLQYRRLRLVREFEELLCLDHLQGVNHYWYQVETVAAVLKRFRGRVLLADEVGLGKTIEAGMLIKEYLLRGLVRKVLILTPPTLVSQWQEEMAEKFALPFVTPDHEAFRAEGGRFWRERDLVIASINTAKSQRYFDIITDIDYDLVVVDEAHYLRNRQTRNHRLIGALRKRFILLLSATPVQNNLLELYNLITLLQPGLLSTEAAFKKEYVKRGNLRQPQNPERLRQLLREVMVRNTRSMVDVKLPKRFAATLYVTPTAVEKEAYEALSAALRRYHEATATPELFTVRNLQMAAGSSPFALRESLDRLCARLTAARTGSAGGNGGMNGGGRGSGKAGENGGENGSAEDRTDENDPAGGTLQTLEDLFAEINRKLAGITETSKGRQLLSLLGRNEEKKLIFVRYRRTLAYLDGLLKENGNPCAVFSGDMTAREKDEAVAAFRGDVPILLSTETGGEGRNIQFCNTLINYDLPWNPMRLEQRIGRVHRIGQERDVFIFNLCLQGSIEDYMMRILDDKINMFELVIGEIDTILGNLETEQDFAGLILDVWLRSGAGEERQANFARLGDEILAAKRTYEKTKALDEMIFGDDYEV